MRYMPPEERFVYPSASADPEPPHSPIFPSKFAVRNLDVLYLSQRLIGIDHLTQGDGGQMPGKRCSNCVTYNLDCTYVEAAKVRYLCSLLSDQSLTSSPSRNVAPQKGMSPFSFRIQGVYVCYTLSYVESLENRLAKMEKLLQTVWNSSSIIHPPTLTHCPPLAMPRC